MNWLDANGFLSFILNVAGNMMLAWKWRSGWAVRIVAIVSWGIYGVQLASKPIILNAITFFCINCYGWWKWSNELRLARLEAAVPERPFSDVFATKADYEKWLDEQRRHA